MKWGTLVKTVYSHGRVGKLLSLFVLCGLFLAPQAHGAPHLEKDIEVLAKSLSYVTNGPRGTTEMAIIYDPNSAESRQEADALMASTKEPLGSRKLKLKGVKVPISQIDSAPQTVWYITKAMDSSYAQIRNAATSKKIITVSNDIGCLDLCCVLTIRSQPTVDVYLSTAIAEQIDLKFSSVFSMMVKKR